MTEPQNDKLLKAEFRHLRETETQTAPGYRRPLAGAAPRGRLRQAMPFAAAAAVLVVSIAVFLNIGRDQPMPEMAVTAPPLPQQADLVTDWEMPTDFLLDTPWFELARTTPDFEFQFPRYDIPEDFSDEI